jgi:hypothetical protein
MPSRRRHPTWTQSSSELTSMDGNSRSRSISEAEGSSRVSSLSTASRQSNLGQYLSYTKKTMPKTPSTNAKQLVAMLVWRVQPARSGSCYLTVNNTQTFNRWSSNIGWRNQRIQIEGCVSFLREILQRSSRFVQRWKSSPLLQINNIRLTEHW